MSIYVTKGKLLLKFSPLSNNLLFRKAHKRGEKVNTKQNRPCSVYQYSNMASSLSGQNCNSLSFSCLLIPKRNLGTKKTTPNMEVCPESLVATFEY